MRTRGIVPAVFLLAGFANAQTPQLLESLRPYRGSQLYRGVTAAIFNDDRTAERLLRSVIADRPGSEEAYQAYEWLAHIYFRTGRYRSFVANMEKRWAAFPNKPERKEEQTAIAGFRGLPDQTSAKSQPATLSHEPGEIFIPISIQHRPATYFFDTGAWTNCMSESEAKRLGLSVHEAVGGSLGTGTGARIGFRTAVVPEMTVGKTRFRNVSFAVFPDDQEPWSQLSPGRRGLIGIPILLGLGSVRWTQDGKVDVGVRSGPSNPQLANLFLENDHLVMSVEVEQRKVFGTLDTGALTTDLYQEFATAFPKLLSDFGRKDATEVRGAGHAETFDSIALPELKVRIGDKEPVLRPAHVLMKQIGRNGMVGNFGLDLLKQGQAFKIDFGAMTVRIE